MCSGEANRIVAIDAVRPAIPSDVIVTTKPFTVALYTVRQTPGGVLQLNTASSRTRKTTAAADPTPTRATRPKAAKASAASGSADAPSPRPRKTLVRGTTDAVAPPKRSRVKAASETVAKSPRRATKTKSTDAAVPPATRKAVASAAPPVGKATRAKRAAVPMQVDERVREAVIARLDAMKANDMKVIDVRGKTSVTDCLVIVSGTSTRHVKSMGDEVIVTAKKHGMPPLGVEGQKDAEWMLVDLGDTVVHLFLPKTREFYGLERLWSLTEEARAQHGALA